jgi:hypothetical protein
MKSSKSRIGLVLLVGRCGGTRNRCSCTFADHWSACGALKNDGQTLGAGNKLCMKLSFGVRSLLGLSAALFLFGCARQTTLTITDAKNARSETTVGLACNTLPYTIDPSKPTVPYVALPGCDPGFTSGTYVGTGDLTAGELAAEEAAAALNTDLYETIPSNAVFDDGPFFPTTTTLRSSTTVANLPNSAG